MEHLWLIAKESSATIYYRNYTQEKIDPDLVSGLLSAFNNFSEVELHGTGIESINMAACNGCISTARHSVCLRSRRSQARQR